MSVPQLKPLPEGFARTKEALHTVAERIVAPARKPDNEISLRATPGGFGTPQFDYEGQSHQVCVDGAQLVHRVDGEEKREPITSLAGAGRQLEQLVPSQDGLDDSPLNVDPAAADALGRWYGLGNAVLEALREEAAAIDGATIVQLWPEHFDIAIELGAEADGRRANYGFSPGDEHHPEPYLYVGPWTAEVEGELWNGKGFNGAEMDYADLVDARDQFEAALQFCRARRDALKSTEG